jgi:tRNA (cytidine/uridine-2'-O-)-methyltransferase
VAFQPDDILLFGPETRGLPMDILGSLPAKQVLRIPMRTGSRSLNLSNTAAIVVYEALRQLDFPFCESEPARD